MTPRALLLVLAILSWAPPARAAGGVGVVVTGDPLTQPQLAAQIEDWLRQRGHLLDAMPLPSEALNTIIDCFVVEDLACARKVVETKGSSPTVVFAKVERTDASGGSRDITITAYWFERDMEAIAVRRSCEKCTDDKLRATTNDLMTALAGKGRAEVGQVVLTSAPSGARVTIDGQDVGVTPLTYALGAGTHQISLTHPTAGSAARTVTIATGETRPVDLQLQVGERPARSRALPLAVIATGGLLVAAGVVAIAVDEDDTGERPEYRDTQPLGITLGVAGLAVVGAGAYLLLRDRPTDDGPRIALLPGGAFVGWGRAF